MKKDTKRRMKKQTIEKNIVNKVMHKIMDWTKKGNNIKIKKMRNKRKQNFRFSP
jgi:hypothetical protein